MAKLRPASSLGSRLRLPAARPHDLADERQAAFAGMVPPAPRRDPQFAAVVLPGVRGFPAHRLASGLETSLAALGRGQAVLGEAPIQHRPLAPVGREALILTRVECGRCDEPAPNRRSAGWRRFPWVDYRRLRHIAGTKARPISPRARPAPAAEQPELLESELESGVRESGSAPAQASSYHSALEL